ncbi:hypothetical protein ACFQJ5_17670 [Halomicroarcula sp. GCM10025324]|uniref:DUF7519 family protein n=1 Tax=Haloarcula TaxID=2237 RepID=UPI0023E88865|nr:hypothetical protein [Halomicroarcula sp. ZS-22-S1]
MTRVDRGPAPLSRSVSLGVAVVAWATSGLYSWAALAVGTAGLLLLVIALLRGLRAAVPLGTFGLFIGAIAAGIQGAPVLPVLLGVTCAVLAGDIGNSSISIGNQLGRAADTTRLETVRVATSITVGVLTAGVGYGLYRSGTSGQPVVALGFLLVAAFLLVETLR